MVVMYREDRLGMAVKCSQEFFIRVPEPRKALLEVNTIVSTKASIECSKLID
jgi:hypothetical protein